MHSFLVTIFFFDELAYFCYAFLFYLLLVVDSLKQVPTEGGREELIKVLGVDHVPHDLQPQLLNIVALRAKSNHSGRVHRHRLQTRVVLILQSLLFVSDELRN